MGATRARSVRGALVLAALGVLAVAPTSAASGPLDRIAYSRLLDGGGAAVFTANPDGSDEQPVPLGDAEEDFGIPIWSPDHTRLLVTNTLRFDGNGDLRPFRPAIVNPDGTGYHVLEIPDGPFDAFCSAWNGDGTRIFCGFGGDTPGIVSVRASDGGDVRRLTTSPFGAAGGDVPADISPDGTELLFIRKRPGPAPDPQQYRPERFALYAINVNGTNLRQIVSWGLVQGHEIQGAHWSPNGEWIISSTPQGKVFTVPAAGGAIKTLKLGVDGFAFEANWSPDGSRIIFGVFGPEQEDLYTANPDGSQVRRVTNTPDFENGPDWR